MTVSIPDWTPEGVLPPVDASSPTSSARSPYRISLVDLVQRFGMSKERIKILDGFLRYRQGLHDAGLTEGFQWLNGSYMERIEELEKRPPNDMDVVSFIEFPTELTELEMRDRFAEVIGLSRSSKKLIKSSLMVDAFMVPMNTVSASELVEQSAYWYSVWSHRRDRAWKGFLQVSLAPNHAARECLDALEKQEADT